MNLSDLFQWLYYSIQSLRYFYLVSIEGGKDKSTYTIDNLFNLMNDDDEEFYPEEDDSENIIKEKAYAKNTQIIYNNIKNLEENREILERFLDW